MYRAIHARSCDRLCVILGSLHKTTERRRVAVVGSDSRRLAQRFIVTMSLALA